MCPCYTDGGGYENLLFEVNPASNSFAYQTSDIEAANIYFRAGCVECSFATQNAVIPDSFTITGTKLSSDSWQIDFDITTILHGA